MRCYGWREEAGVLRVEERSRSGRWWQERVRRAHLVDALEDVAGGGAAEGVDEVAEDDGHARLRQAVGQRGHRADQHQQQVCGVGVPEQPREGHPLPVLGALLLLLPLLLAIPPSYRCVHCWRGLVCAERTAFSKPDSYGSTGLQGIYGAGSAAWAAGQSSERTHVGGKAEEYCATVSLCCQIGVLPRNGNRLLVAALKYLDKKLEELRFCSVYSSNFQIQCAGLGCP